MKSQGRGRQSLLLISMMVFGPALLLGKVTGSISGTARDAQGAVIPGVAVSARNEQTGVVLTAETDSVGFYNFPALPIGTYDVKFQKSGFQDYQETGLIIDVDTALRADAALVIGATVQTVTVTAAAAQVNTETSQTGEVIGGTEMVNLPLNGRAFTDLLTLQPGVVPIGVQLFGTLNPQFNSSNGTLSMSGQRDVQNGYMVNGANTVEGDMGGTLVVPNLDSIAEFRIITSNGGAEYGNYSGGQVNVITKGGTNQFHGDAFEFVRNSDFDSRNFFSATRGVFHQNMFGGTVGGPILHNKLFFFADYQGTRQIIGVDTGDIVVPSMQDKEGNLLDQETNILSNTSANAVGSPYFASVLATRLGYGVTSGEPYFGANCTTTAQCVFPGFIVPQSAWDTPSANILKLIPNPNAGAFFSTAANPNTLQDNRSGLRIDANTKIGMISGYWHYDPWSNVVPYNAGYGGSSVPGFPGTNAGKAQVYTLGITTNFGGNKVNQFTGSYFRNKNLQALATGSGPTLASLGFAAPGVGGIYQEEGPQYQNWPTMSFSHFNLGPSNTVFAYYNQTNQLQDDFSIVKGTHTIKVGADYHWDQFWVAHTENGGDGGFGFNGTETGYDLSDMLVGAPDYFYQGAPSALSLRSYYAGFYGQDSWRVTHNLTVNYGLRWEQTPYWSDSHNRNPDLVLGCQSAIFPTAPSGYCFPGDDGIPKHFARTRWDNFAPRLGVAYAPNFTSGFLHTVFGDAGKTSIRAGFGTYYTNVEGASTFNFASPPYALFFFTSYLPQFSTPFINRQTGNFYSQPFTNPFPVIPALPGDTNINWAADEPINGKNSPTLNDPTPYAEHLDFSIERQLQSSTLLTVSYVGTFGHHLLLTADNNPSNPALCSSLMSPSAVLPGTPTCGPNSETGLFYPVSGPSTGISIRQPFGALYAGNGSFFDAGNSDYHSLQTSLRKTSGRSQWLVSYTFSKAMDDGSGFGDQVFYQGNNHLFEALSVFDLTHNFSASYTYELPFDKLLHSNNRGIRGWKISGVTSFSTGTPIQLYEVDDRSLVGSANNSPQYSSTDEPQYTPGNIVGQHNPRLEFGPGGGLAHPYFNTSLFDFEPLGGQGSANRRFFHGPGINNWNLALLKDVRLTETKRLEFRAEFFNAFNHTQFVGGVDGNILDGPSSFGGIFGAAAPRIGQLAGKFYF